MTTVGEPKMATLNRAEPGTAIAAEPQRRTSPGAAPDPRRHGWTATDPDPEWRPWTATLNALPYQIAVGETVEVTGTRYTPGAQVDIIWHSVEGRYKTEGLWLSEFVGQEYAPVNRVIATTVADSAGEIRASFEVPSDFGGPHDIRGRVDGIEVSQGGVTVTPVWSMTPTEGPVGTMVELKIVGIDVRIQVNTWHLLWDNHYFGMMTGVTTHGVGTARFRAAGPVGVHYIAAWNNSHQSAPYLGWDTCPYQDEFPGGLDFQFRVTEDPGVLPLDMEDFSALDNPWETTVEGPGRLCPTPDRGIVGSTTTLQGSNLPPSARLQLIWATVTGGGIIPLKDGARELRRNLGEVRTAPDGTFSTDFKVPHDLGGQHRIEICQGSNVLAAAGFVVSLSIISYTQKVRAGEPVHVQMDGCGWTNIDNTYAVTWDNSYIGYSCGVSNSGDIQFRFTATGVPGTHLLDLYPMIYKGKAELPRGIYSMPQLTYTDDHPLRKTPSIRFSIEVVE